MKKDLLIFLDFDGVLHHIFPLKDNTDQQNEKFHFVDNFEETIKKLTKDFDVKIVFSTSWKEKFSFEELKGFFEDLPYCYNAMIDSTPNLKHSTDEGYKWLEAKEWMDKNNYKGNYLILDDYPLMWQGCDQKKIIFCNDKFSDEEIESVFKTTHNLLKNNQDTPSHKKKISMQIK